MSARIRAREATDMSPIPPEDAPEELAPLLESLNEQLGRVRANLEAQRRFVGDAAHQLRTPLAGLKTQAQIAVREWPAPSVRDRLERIEQSATRMGHLVTQLLALARADDLRTRDTDFEPVDLDDLVRDVCTQLADEAIAARMSIAFERSEAAARVNGSPMLLRELFGNLVDNAIHYGPAGGEITVRVRSGAACEVAVEDNGPGIPPAEREFIFARFYRVLGTGEAGSGLGLAIVKEIAGLHHATIRIETPPAGGTRFVVAFAPPGKP
jgi:two-component system sensor histidine kinase TctE